MNTLNETLKLIKPSNKTIYNETSTLIDNLTKPIGSLGKLETITAKIMSIFEKIGPVDFKKTTIIMCADNGVVEEGVSACPQSVTYTVTENFTKDITAISNLSTFFGSDTTIVDIGVKGEFDHPLIYNHKVLSGTNNMAYGPAMTQEEALKAINIGIDMVDKLVSSGYNLLGTGEMGIGNTTTSAAVLCALEGLPADLVTGKGAGITSAQHKLKQDVILKAIKINNPKEQDVIDVLSKVGGLDIAGLCGCFLGAAKNKTPIVIDGFISAVAALCAFRLSPDVIDYMFPSHLSQEPGISYVMDILGLEPFLNLDLRLGEGSGCPIAFNIIESAIYTMLHMGTFEDAHVDSATYIDIRNIES